MYRQFWSLCRENRSEERKGGGKGKLEEEDEVHRGKKTIELVDTRESLLAILPIICLAEIYNDSKRHVTASIEVRSLSCGLENLILWPGKASTRMSPGAPHWPELPRSPFCSAGELTSIFPQSLCPDKASPI
jgi:hypothetical protein